MENNNNNNADNSNGVENTFNMPRLGEKAPYFEANTTHGPKKITDYKGKWLILFSHPADFTPVCTTEFIAFQKIKPELDKRNVELLGLSIDSIYSHIAWVNRIHEKFGVKIEFPIIDDISMNIAKKYGMIHPNQSSTSASRCVFVIDPKLIVRAMIYYPLSTGRNMNEILRLIDALQTTDEHSVATPANWKPFDDVIIFPANTSVIAEKRINDEKLKCKDWFFCTKNIKTKKD